MALYLGSGEKVKLSIGSSSFYSLNIPSAIPIVNGVMLLSSDGYMLTDINNLYLTSEESE